MTRLGAVMKLRRVKRSSHGGMGDRASLQERLNSGYLFHICLAEFFGACCF